MKHNQARIPKAKIRALGYYADTNGKEWALYRIGDQTHTIVTRGFKTQQDAYKSLICNDKYCEVHNPETAKP